MTFESKKLRDASRGQFCVRCGNPVGVVGCHYTGVRRGSYGGGFGQKVHDFLTADLCPGCHSYMDSASRDKSKKWEHSEEFQHYIILTLERRFVQGVIVVSRGRHEVVEMASDAVEVRGSASSPSPQSVSEGTPEESASTATGDASC